MASHWKKFIGFIGKRPSSTSMSGMLNQHSRRIFIADAPSMVPDHL
jgi:hypothetical protein